MSCTGTTGCMCGCCAGTTVETPAVQFNRPGLPAVSYRVGSWATFKDSMLARLSSFDYPALAALKTRDDDDFTIAFLDATSVVLDILSFYQERLANESYLRTAAQLRSLIELSRLIGYQPAPGVSAATYVAFRLKTAPGQTPDPSAPAITIPEGTQMQSVPAQGQQPQTFETSADIPAKPDWNALPVQTGTVWAPVLGHQSVYLQGTSTQLQPGDQILVVGDERENHRFSERWDLREVTSVVPDGLNSVTYVQWSKGLGDATAGVHPAHNHPKFYAFRQRSALFGYNAVNPLLLSHKTLSALQTANLVTSGTNPEWKFKSPGDKLIDLESVYSKVTSNSWIALIRPDNPNTNPPLVHLYLVNSVASISHSEYGVSSKVTRASVDTDWDLGPYYDNTRETIALVQSERLTVPLQPLLYPLYGSSVDLQDLRPDLSEATVIAISGKRQKVSVNTAGLQFSPDDSTTVNLEIGDLLTLTNPAPLASVTPTQWTTGSGMLTLEVEDSTGRPGTMQADLKNLLLAASGKKDPVVSECALLASVDPTPGATAHTVFTLQAALMNCYERATTTVNANVVLASNGQSVSEVMGGGSASTPNQEFVLKQSPLTYVQAPTANGRESTLEVQVNGVKWTEVPTLYQQSSSSQVFVSRYQSGSETDVLFGDGVEGTTLPTGQNNVLAQYRIGSGASGNIAAGTLTTLLDRPLGVSGVTNPQSATGGQDAQSIGDIRINAPQTVLTLGRAVSIADYQSYAATFAGISKAYAIWIPSGPGRGVFLTVAGVDGEALPASSPTLNYLTTSLRSYGNPLIPVTAKSFLETLFGFSADVKYDPAHDQPTVQAAVRAAVTNAYSFANRTFGEGVSVDGIGSVIQSVAGVIAVNVKEIHTVATSTAGDLASGGGAFTIRKLNAWLAQQITLTRPFSDSPGRICPYLPIPSLTSLPPAAEILVLDPDPSAVTWGVMS